MTPFVILRDLCGSSFCFSTSSWPQPRPAGATRFVRCAVPRWKMFALFVQSRVMAQTWREKTCVHFVGGRIARLTPTDATTYRDRPRDSMEPQR